MIDLKTSCLATILVTLVTCINSQSSACFSKCQCAPHEDYDGLYREVYCSWDTFFNPTNQVVIPPTFQVSMSCYENEARNIPTDPLNYTMSHLYDKYFVLGLSFVSCPVEKLAAEYFQGLPNIVKISIALGNIGNITDDCFKDITTLKAIELRYAGLNTVPNVITCYNSTSCSEHVPPILLQLYLQNNDIKDPPKETFQNLVNLQELDLSGNNLQSPHRDLFTPLANLEMLSLFNNAIVKLQPYSFRNLTNLKILKLGLNQFTTIDSGTFDGLVSLEELYLANNQLTTLPSDTFHGLTKLRYLILSYSCFEELPSDLFQGLNNLQLVDLSESGQVWDKRDFVPRDIFTNLPALQAIDLHKTYIRSLENFTFEGCTSLLNIDLRLNFISTLPQDLINHIKVPHLKKINLSNNNISTLLSHTFQKSDFLMEINLSYNSLEVIPEYAFSQLSSVTSLDLSYNSIASLHQHALYDIPRLSELKLTGNNLVNLQVFRFTQQTVPMSVYINENPLSCDCAMFATLFNKTGAHKYDDFHNQDIVGFNNLVCSSPERVAGRSLASLDLYDFRCERPDLCPDKCTCHQIPMDEMFHANCSYIGLQEIPTNFWRNTTVISLQGNNITYVTKKQMSLVPNVQELILANNSITYIEPDAFEPLAGLLYLDMDFNFIPGIPATLFKTTTLLQKLYLNFNNISYIDVLSFQNLMNLQELMFVNNRLEILDIDVFNSTTSLHLLAMHNNPYVCGCHSWWLELQDFLSKPEINSIVPYQNNVTCSVPHTINDTSEWPILQLSENDIICDEIHIVLETKHFDFSSSITISVLGIAVFIVIVMATVFRLRQVLRIVIYNKTGCRLFVKKEDFEEDKVYDAFLSFSSTELDWVKNTLLRNLENHDPPYKVCIHHRDFIVGACIADNIVDAVMTSRRTIMVLTNSFLESEWCTYEFKQAHQQILTDKNCKLIVLMMEDIDPEKLKADKELKTFLETNTYLEKDDPLFWKKLYYAMPDVNDIRKLNRPAHRKNRPHALDDNELTQIDNKI